MNAFVAAIGALSIAVGAAQASEATHAPPPPPPGAATHAQLEQAMQHAQEEMEKAAREMADLGRELGEDAWAKMPPGDFGVPRAMLGIHIEDENESRPDTAIDGVKILSVSPGGPADAAGLKANDVILSLDGKSVHDAGKGSSQHQFMALAHDLKPDVPVAIAYRRAGQLQTAQVVPKSLSVFVADSMSRGWQGMRDGFDEYRPFSGRGDPSTFGSAELADLSPGLGHYFGTEKGLLVVRAPKDDRLKLQDGDVILDVDGRVPTSVAHAYQILSSYRPGESLKLHVMRQQKRLELTIQIPADPDPTMEPAGAGDAGHHPGRPMMPERHTEL